MSKIIFCILLLSSTCFARKQITFYELLSRMDKNTFDRVATMTCISQLSVHQELKRAIKGGDFKLDEIFITCARLKKVSEVCKTLKSPFCNAKKEDLKLAQDETIQAAPLIRFYTQLIGYPKLFTPKIDHDFNVELFKKKIATNDQCMREIHNQVIGKDIIYKTKGMLAERLMGLADSLIEAGINKNKKEYQSSLNDYKANFNEFHMVVADRILSYVIQCKNEFKEKDEVYSKFFCNSYGRLISNNSALKEQKFCKSLK